MEEKDIKQLNKVNKKIDLVRMIGKLELRNHQIKKLLKEENTNNFILIKLDLEFELLVNNLVCSVFKDYLLEKDLKNGKDLNNFLKEYYLDLLDLTLDYVYFFIRDIKKIDISSISVEDFKKANRYLNDCSYGLLPNIKDIIFVLKINYKMDLNFESIFNEYLLERKLR